MDGGNIDRDTVEVRHIRQTFHLLALTLRVKTMIVRIEGVNRIHIDELLNASSLRRFPDLDQEARVYLPKFFSRGR